MNVLPYLVDQATFITDLAAKMRDASHARWSSALKYSALNDAIRMWDDKVLVPHLYTITDGWVAGTYAYTLPDYVRGRIQPEMLRTAYDYPYTMLSSSSTTWLPVTGWHVEPDGSGGQKLRLDGIPYSTEGRIIWYTEQSTLPATAPTITTSSITSSSTSVIVDAAVAVESAGYVKIEAEWIHYADITRGATTTTLSNLTRGINDTAAASHNTAVTVYWGIAMPERSLYNQLMWQTRANLHAMNITDGADHERSNHEKPMAYFQKMADDYWMKHVGLLPKSKLILRRQGMSHGR